MRLIRSKRTPPHPNRTAPVSAALPESVPSGTRARAQASEIYAIILGVASALREHQDDAQDSPELEAKAMVVDQSHHDFYRSRAEPVSCRESGDAETGYSCAYVFSQFFAQLPKIVLD